MIVRRGSRLATCKEAGGEFGFAGPVETAATLPLTNRNFLARAHQIASRPRKERDCSIPIAIAQVGC
jgi:hypothetical protein